MTEKELMKKLAQGMFDRIPDLNDIPPAQEEFSDEHKAKMEKLFAKPQWYMVFYRIPRRVLIAVLTFIIIVAVPLSVKAIREPLFSFISGLFGGERTEYFSSDKDKEIAENKKINTYFKLYYVPEGFELVSEKKTDTLGYFEYSNGNETFSFEQKRVSSAKPYIPENAQDIDPEYANTPWDITYYKVGNKNVFLWIYGYNEFRLTADEAIPLDTLKEIADNALDELGYEERKQLESGNIAVANNGATPLNPPETIPQAFRFELPEGLKIKGWEDNTSFDKKVNYIILVESDKGYKCMSITVYDKTIPLKITVEDTAQDVIVNNIVVSCFDKAQVYIWTDEKFTYTIDAWDDSISSETVINIVRSIYNME